MKDKNIWPEENYRTKEAETENEPIDEIVFNARRKTLMASHDEFIGINKPEQTSEDEPDGWVKATSYVITGFIITIIGLALFWVIVFLIVSIFGMIR